MSKDNDRPHISPERACVGCRYKEDQQVRHPQSGEVYDQYICKHPKVCDPVTGEQFACNVARRELVFCGYDGRYFAKKEEAQVIQITKKPLALVLPSDKC